MIEGMAGTQLDLFDAVSSETAEGRVSAAPCGGAVIDPAELADEALIAALPEAGLTTAPALAAEAGRRSLSGAVGALDLLCRRLVGFGANRVVPEQAAALDALAAIGGETARRTVARIIANRIVQGPTLSLALDAAIRLGASLPPPCLAPLLRHPDPAIRARACRCARSAAFAVGPLTELLDDLNPAVFTAAACALGRLGRIEARPALIALLRTQPGPEIIDALASVADEEAIVAIGRIGRTIPELAEAARDALDNIDDPRAMTVATTLQRASEAAT
jgi:HEAT repeats